MRLKVHVDETSRHLVGCLLLPLINRAVEDFVRNRSAVYQLPGEVPFHELGTAAKRPDNGASRKIGDGTGCIRVRKIEPGRNTRMTNGNTVTGVSGWWDV